MISPQAHASRWQTATSEPCKLEWEHLVLLFAVLLVGLTLTNSKINFVHNETYSFLEESALKDGPTLWPLEVLRTSLDIGLEGSESRPRFYNWIAWVVNSKLRYYLFQWVTPWPSVALTWIFTLVLMPIFFYRFAFLFSGENKRAAILATSVFITTVGFLCHHVMYFHSAKPMSLLGVLLTMFQILKMRRKSVDNRLLHRDFLKLLFVVLAFMFWDEFYYVVFVLAPILFLNFYRQEWRRLLVVYGSAFLWFWIVNLWIVPALLPAGHHFDFIKYAFLSNDNLTEARFPAFWENVWTMLDGAMHFFRQNVLFPSMPNINTPWFTWLTLLTLLAPFVYKKFRDLRTYLSIWLAIVVYWLLQELIVSRCGGRILYGGFSWGIPFHLFLSLAFLEFAKMNERGRRRLAPILVAIVMCVSGVVSNAIGAYSQAVSNLSIYPKIQYLNMGGFEGVTRKEIKEIWKTRENLDILKQKLQGRSINLAWLYYEAYKQNEKGYVYNPSWGYGAE